jgi:molecular chaperone HscB
VIDLRDKTDHFGVFDLPRRLEVDLEALEREFLRLSRELHPDRFVASGPEAVAESQRNSARVNDAYRALKDPAARAEHLLELAGVERKEGEAKCPPDLLAEVFELRESIAEGPDEGVCEQVATLLEDADRRIGELFARHDRAGDSERPGVLAELRTALDRRQFLVSLDREVVKALGSR